MLIAVATSDGITIDRHFGHADRFIIYEVAGDEITLNGEREVEKYCSVDPDHPLRKHILEATVRSLGGCRALVCTQIGPSPQMELERLGIEVYCAEGPVRETLRELAKLF